jgi:glyoxylase-like metal-dependent hydrolase (beta-lactamase superfamily II)
MPPNLILETITSTLFEENCYVLAQPGRTDCLVVDPGLEPGRILARLDELRLAPAAILNTHGHCDHIAGNGALKRRFPDAPIVIGRGDAIKLVDAHENLSAEFSNSAVSIVSPEADRLVDEGDEIDYAGFHLTVREIPGHSVGHVVFIWQDSSPTVVLGGDVLFAGSVGRTDLKGGSFKQLAAGIHAKLFTLADDAIVLPGHGPPTTIGREKRANPFVGAPAGYRS